MSTAFTLGFYGSNPDLEDPAANAAFEAGYNAFTALLGAKPATMDSFVDFSLDPSQWAANAQYAAASWANTGAAYVGPSSGTIPVIGIPLASNSGGWANVDSFYQAIVAGTDDADYQGIVDAWANNGYKTIDLRLGYEFDGNFMPWSPGSSGSPTANADFVAAWQHLADLVHARGAADGITVNTVWNPTDISWSPATPTSLYPGNQYVDIIGTDAYSPIYGNGLTNWPAPNTAAVSSSSSVDQAEWLQDPVNREHAWTYSNASIWTPTGQNAGWSIQQALELATITGKPLGIAETGATGSVLDDPAGDAAFPAWLASELSQPSAPPIAFVNIWATDQADGQWGFLDGEQPAEAAAWAASFGAGSASNPAGPAADPAPLSLDPNDVAQRIGAGPDALTLYVSEDAYQGDAAFTVTIDGVQVGGTQTATASKALSQDQAFVLYGAWGAGPHTVAVDFLNDAWGGTAALDRNLYVDGAIYDGIATPEPLQLYTSGAQTMAVGVAGAPLASFVDDRGASLTLPVITSGSQTRYAGVLDGNVHQWIDGTTAWLSTDTFGALVTTAGLTDGIGGSYGISNFEEADVSLSGSPDGSLKIVDAAGGQIRLGSGNYQADITAMAANDTAARNTFGISLGSGNQAVTLDASAGWGHTSVNLQAGTGTDTANVIWAGSTTVMGGPGQATVSITGGENTVYAAGGALEINATAGATAYHFNAGDGLLTIDQFDPAAGDSLWLDSRLQAGLAQTPDGHGGIMVYISIPTVGIDLKNAASFNPSVIHWT